LRNATTHDAQAGLQFVEKMFDTVLDDGGCGSNTISASTLHSGQSKRF